MSSQTSDHTVFTKSLFRAGNECITKLYYRSEEAYPENGSHLPYAAHNAFNKRMLGLLLKSSLPVGYEIKKAGYSEMNRNTEQLLKQTKVVIYNASFLIDRLFAKVPVLVRNGQEVDAYFVQTRAVHSGNPNFHNRNGVIRSKWIDYLSDIAYQLLVVERKHPEWEVNPWLVLPNRKEVAGTDRLDLTLARMDQQLLNEPDRLNTLQTHIKLLVKIPVKSHVGEIRNGSYLDKGSEKKSFKDFEERVMEMSRLYREGEKVAAPIGNKCKSCEFRIGNELIEKGFKSGFRECWQDKLDIGQHTFETPHVFDLFGSGTGRMIDNGIYYQKDLTIDQKKLDRIYHSNGRITDHDRQLLQIQKAKGEEREDVILKPQLKDELTRWLFPLHFIDFEAGTYAVPLRKGHRPYDAVVFQFSCHTLREDGELIHRDWIGLDPERCNNYELVRELSAIPDINSGTLIHYSNFERHILKQIQAELQMEQDMHAAQLAAWIRDVIGRNDSSSTAGPYLVDMNRLVRNYYYNPYMENSLSIKDILSAVMQVSPYLEERYSEPYDGSNFKSFIWWKGSADNEVMNPYSVMEEEQAFTIRRGTQAMAAYARLRTGMVNREQRREIIQSLRQYCEMDTLAMVMIHQHWRELLETS